IEDKINEKLKSYVDEHLKKCPKCREVYLQSKKIARHVLGLVDNLDETPYMTKQYENFKNNLSAYVDNELDENESIRMKKIAISNPLARKDLEDMYSFKKMMHNSFEKTKAEWKNDYSKLIITQLDKTDYYKNSDPFLKLLAFFCVIIGVLVAGLMAMLNF
ncbi:hypothetical protein IJZ97_03825, partial [bacterium]|nr:hypothetical protein [bacterium]